MKTYAKLVSAWNLRSLLIWQKIDLVKTKDNQSILPLRVSCFDVFKGIDYFYLVTTVKNFDNGQHQQKF